MTSAIARQPRPAAGSLAAPRGDDETARRVETDGLRDVRSDGDSAPDDLIEHQRTFERFLSLLVVAVQHIASCLIALAIGGVEGHWTATVVFVAFATAAALSGAFVRSLGWRPGAAILAIEIVTWVLLA